MVQRYYVFLKYARNGHFFLFHVCVFFLFFSLKQKNHKAIYRLYSKGNNVLAMPCLRHFAEKTVCFGLLPLYNKNHPTIFATLPLRKSGTITLQKRPFYNVNALSLPCKRAAFVIPPVNCQRQSGDRREMFGK